MESILTFKFMTLTLSNNYIISFQKQCSISGNFVLKLTKIVQNLTVFEFFEMVIFVFNKTNDTEIFKFMKNITNFENNLP